MARSVTIKNKKGESICRIDAPQKWWSDLPIPYLLFLISKHREWEEPELVEKWAWQQAYQISSKVTKEGLKDQDLLSPNFAVQCLVCKKQSVKTMLKHWRWSRNYELDGYACTNEECTMSKVIIPHILCASLSDMPMEYYQEIKSYQEQS